jgi:hypothetical protein
MVSLAAAGAVFLALRRDSAFTLEDADAPSARWIFGTVVVTAFAWLLWLARPELLPTGSGPDLVHHLALIEYIQQHWRLVHDAGLGAYLGEMVDYTPGFHLLTALAGAWIPGFDGLHAVYPVIAFTVALKFGIVFLIARRLVRLIATANAFAIAAVFALLAPRVYSIGSFTEQSYLAQVASELFAIAAWWMAVVWDEQPSLGPMLVMAVFAVAGFLVWPVWTGPVLLLLAATALQHTERPLAERARQTSLVVAAIAAIAAMHGSRHVGGFRIAGTGGFVIAPTTAVVPWPFLAASAAGAAVSAFSRRTRSVALLVAGIALQAAALYHQARASGAANPYLAVKMFYLAIYPMAVAVALLAARVWQRIVLRVALLRTPTAAWAAAAAVAVPCALPAMDAPRPKPVVTEPVLRAAAWAGAHAPSDCIDYLTQDGYTAYWLHLAVFGNARASGRATDDDTFEPRKALVRWILPGGLKYAITDDLNALPRDIRDNVDVLARFGDAAVVRRRGASASPCP